MHRKALLGCLVALLATSISFGDIQINGYTHATNDRFTNSPTFIASGLNLTGVGQTDGGTSGTAGRWATAISRNVFISANHYRPANGATVYFYRNNDPNLAPITRKVVSGMKVGSTDLYVGVLDQNLPLSIAHYVFATEALTGPPPDSNGNITIVNAGSYQNLNAYLIGKSPFNHNTNPNDNRWSYNDQAVGRNKIFGYSENVPFTDSDNDSILVWHDASGSPDFVQYEARLRGGDSGGPMFVSVNGQLVLLGTNAFLLNGDAGSGINYTGNQADAIFDYINFHAVPEPGTGILILAGLSAFAATNRTRKR